MADALVRLNANWRVADDPPQWVLEKRVREPQPGKTSGWQARKYIRTTDHLLKRIGEMCGTVGSEAIEIIRSWPVGYVTWKAREMQCDAGPETAPHSAISVSEVYDHQKTLGASVAAPESDLESIDEQAA